MVAASAKQQLVVADLGGRVLATLNTAGTWGTALAVGCKLSCADTRSCRPGHT